MTLKQHMRVIPLSRYNGFPSSIDVQNQQLVVCALLQKAEKACARLLRGYPAAKIAAVCLPVNQLASLEAKSVKADGKFVPAISIQETLNNYGDCLPVLFWDGCIVPDVLYFQELSLKRKVMIFPRLVPGMIGCKHDPDFYDAHAQKLQKIYGELADEDSKAQFASVVKAIVTGDIEWVLQSPYEEYHLPPALPKKNDVIVDAGLFDSVVLRQFALAAPEGLVYGFEPEPHNFSHVRETLRKYGDPGNIRLVKKGLYSKKDVMFISDQGSSGNLSNESSKGSACEVIDLDSFARENAIGRVDLVKMDIEGAELEALKGAKATISRFRPKLHICAYHHVHDLLAIPELLEDIAHGIYQLHFAAHVPYMNEYVYYAVPKISPPGSV